MALHKSTQRDFLRSQSVVKKRRKKRMIRLSVRVGLLVALIVSTGLLSQIDFFSIKSVVISGNIHLTTEEVQKIVDTSLSKKYIFLFPKRNVFMYPKDEIVANLKSVYPRILDVQVYTESFNTLNVRIEERVHVSTWCSVILCYEIDSEGYIYAPKDDTNEVSTVTFTGMDEKIGSEPVGVHIFEKDIYTELLQITTLMAEIGLPIQTIEFRSKDEVYFWITGSKKRVIFTSRKSYTEAFENLKAALLSKVFSATTEFEYIDTRFGNKVFYKLQQVEKATTTEKKKR